MGTFDSAEQSDTLNDTMDQMAEKLFYEDIARNGELEVSESKIKKGAWIASILANSPNDNHKQKALSYSLLALLQNQNSEFRDLYRKYAVIQLARLGSLPVLDAIRSNGGWNLEEWQNEGTDSILLSELSQTYDYYRIDDDSILTEFQMDIWNKLDEKYLVFSGPTSSGKSHVLKEFIKRKASEGPFQAIYVVPTRALISEVSRELRPELDEVSVLTGVNIDQIEHDDFILVLTPERCLSLLEYKDDENVNIDLIFIDEIQNLEDESRGPLFESVLQSITEIWGRAQVFAAGPYISNPDEVLTSMLNVEPEKITTFYTPVLHLESRFTFKKRSKTIDVELRSPSGRKISDQIDRPTNLNYSTVKGNKSQAIKKLVENFGNDDQTLIYSKTRRMAESMALSIAESRDGPRENPRVRELTEFLSTYIHPEYSLAKTLEFGVGFHHSSVPKIARQEIEDLYKDEVIDTIVSTSTLLEGVNLPAEKMFILDPSKGFDRRLTNFDFQNLVGRVGRVGSKLYGTIIYVDREDDNWSKGRLEESGRKEVTSATDKVFNDKMDELLDHISDSNINSIGDKGLRYTITILRNKYQKESHDLEEYLTQKKVSDKNIEQMNQELGRILNDLTVPNSILKKNPTVDPVLQNELYNQVTLNPDEWEIRPNNLLTDLFTVSRKLNWIFKFTHDHRDGLTLPDHVETETKEADILRILYPAHQWLTGASYNEMINRRREALDEEKTVDTSIKNLLAVINQDVRFVLVKYYKILSDILKSIDDYENEFMMGFDKRLERGAYLPGTLKLIDLGVDRSIAVTLDPPEENVENYIQGEKRALSPLFRRHLESQGIIE